MLLKLVSGDNLWSSEGVHVCDDKGMAIVVAEDTEVDIEGGKYDFVLGVVKAWRETRGCDPDTGLPLPPPVEETPAIEGAING